MWLKLWILIEIHVFYSISPGLAIFGAGIVEIELIEMRNDFCSGGVGCMLEERTT